MQSPEEIQPNDLQSVVPVMRLSVLDWVAMVVLIAGGLNWGLVGVLNLDLFAAVLGDGTGVARAAYMAVGLAAVYCLYFLWRLGGGPAK